MDAKLKKQLRFAADNLANDHSDPESAEAVLKVIELVEDLEQQRMKVAIAAVEARTEIKHALHAAEIVCEALKIPK